MAAKKDAAHSTLTFRDQVYTSRTLVLPGDRTVPVSKKVVQVAPEDTELLDYLNLHPDFRREE